MKNVLISYEQFDDNSDCYDKFSQNICIPNTLSQYNDQFHKYNLKGNLEINIFDLSAEMMKNL